MPESAFTGKGPGVRAMFDRIARRYDLMNRLMTFGRDQAWRRYVVRMAALPERGRLLDVATGTGMIALEALGAQPGLSVTACDFSVEMMTAGRHRNASRHLDWCCADGLRLPFPDDSFHGVTSGFLIRNVSDPLAVFQEQVRVVHPGGRVVCLDTAPPAGHWAEPLVRLQLNTVIPLLGRWVAGDADAYRYLPESTKAFHSPATLTHIMETAGLEAVSFRLFMLETIVVLVGTKPAQPASAASR